MIFRALNLWKKKFEKASDNEQFKQLALMYYGGKYTWGKETLEEVDCSGLICGVLTLMGYPIRVTADELMTKFFNKDVEDQMYDEDNVKLVFFIAKDSYSSQAGNRLAGRAKHVGILMGDNVMYHAVDPYVCFEQLDDVIRRYDTSIMVMKGINWDAIKTEGGKYGLDPELLIWLCFPPLGQAQDLSQMTDLELMNYSRENSTDLERVNANLWGKYLISEENLRQQTTLSLVLQQNLTTSLGITSAQETTLSSQESSLTRADLLITKSKDDYEKEIKKKKFWKTVATVTGIAAVLEAFIIIF